MRNISLNKNEGKVKILVLLGVGLLVILLFPKFTSPRMMTFTILGLVGAIQTLGLNIFFGYCGQINFGVAGFFAIGGYSVALMEKYLGTPFAINLVAGLIFAGFVGLVISLFLVRLRGHSLALGTFAFSLAIYTSVAKGFKSYTGGEDGINLAHLMLFNGSGASDSFYYYLLVAVVAACCWLSWTLRQSRVGRAMIEIAQNETAATSFGVNINRYIRLGLVLNGAIAGIAGAIFIKWTSWISPEYFGIMANIIVVLALIVGGKGSIVGAIVGGIFMFILPQLMIGFAEYSLFTYGIILCVFLLFLPRGIVGEIENLYFRCKNKFVSQEKGE
jgi:branched-chain amino acid transport system permease protein